MKSNLICMLITIVAYLILMIVVGILASKKNKDTSDFYLGGRKLGPIVTAMSAEASDMSSYLLMGLPGLALLTGFADVGWTVIGLAIGTYLNWLLVAKRLRIYSQHNGSITIPDFFSNRYHDNKHFLMGISAIIILIFFVPYTASGFSACGKLFQTLFGMNYHAAMILSAVIIIAYTSIGGFLAASTTDLLQSIIMTVALVMVVVFGIVKAGGIDVVMENAKALPGYLSFNHTYDITTNSAKPYNILTICSTLAWGLGYFGMPHILLRFMAIEDSRKIKTSRRIASIWVVISMGIAILIGFIGKTLMTNSTISVLGDNPDNFSAESETVIMKIATLISEHGCIVCRSDFCRNPCLHDVYFRLSAAGSILQYVRKPAARRVRHQAFGKDCHAGSTCCSADYRCDFHRYRMESGQLCFPYRILCMGWIWCNFWACYAVCVILEAFQQVGSFGWTGCRRCDGICMEVPRSSAGRSMGSIRTAASLYRGSGCHCYCFAADKSTGTGTGRRI